MKAHFSKNEEKTMFGGTKYVVKALIELEPGEKNVYEKHKLWQVVIIGDDFTDYLTDKRTNDALKARKRIHHGIAIGFVSDKGVPFKIEFSQLSMVSRFEDAFYEGCERLKSHIEGNKAEESEIGTSSTREF